jgi:hypothetical protein
MAPFPVDKPVDNVDKRGLPWTPVDIMQMQMQKHMHLWQVLTPSTR